MKDIAMLNGAPVEIHGHCRVDYTDPVTGKVLERVEGNNHVFVDQFMSYNWQETALQSMLLLTNGDADLDTDVPLIPGSGIGYGTIGSQATGLWQGSYRSSDSFYNRIGANKVTNMYVYDFLHTQIGDKIRYVGLTANRAVGVGTAPFIYRWARDNYNGIVDIERKKLYYDFTVTLSSNQGGNGTILCRSIGQSRDDVAQTFNLFDAAERPDYYSFNGYQTTWGYDYENQYLVLKLMRYRRGERYYNKDGSGSRYWYKYYYRDDIYVFSTEDGSLVKHFTYINDLYDDEHETTNSSWQYLYGHDASGFGYMRLYGDILYFFSKYNPQYSSVNAWQCVLYKYDITMGDVSSEVITSFVHPNGTNYNPIKMWGQRAYFYKGLFWGQYRETSRGTSYDAYGMDCMPMYDVYSESVYSWEGDYTYPSYGSRCNSWVIQKGLTNVYRKTWWRKDGDGAVQMRPVNPFAYTAYKLPSDAPDRPENSAVTIAYGLTINW